MSRRVVIVLVVITLVACEPTGGATTPARRPAVHTYSIFMGAPSPDGRDLGFTSFFPSSVTIHAGDSVELFNRGGFQAPHTVTFGAQGETPVVVDGALNPRVADACAATDVTSPCSVSGSWTALPPYDGDGFWSTGVVYDYGRVEISTAPDLAPGDYPFACLIHPSMRGELRVVGPDERADDPVTVHADALRRSDAAAEAALEPPAPRVADGSVAAGWRSDDLVVNRFSPSRLEVSAGDTVTWIASSLQDVTFDTSVGVPRVSSGPLADGTIYRMRFDRPGIYRYHSTLHLGMSGVVVVGR